MKFLGALTLVVVLLAIVGIAVGWVTFGREGDQATIEIKTGEMEQAAGRAVVRGREIVDDAAQAVDSTIEDHQPAPSPEPPATETTEIEITVPANESKPDPET